MMSKQELEARLAELRTQLASASGQRLANLETALTAVEEQLATQQQAEQNIRRLANNPAATVSGDSGSLPTAGPFAHRPSRPHPVPLNWSAESPDLARAHGHMVVDGLAREGVASTSAADRLSALIDQDDLGLDALYLRAASSPAYERAFGKLLAHGPAAAMRMDQDEQASVQQMFRVQAMRASVGGYAASGLSTGTGASGGFAVPTSLDPTVLATSDGVVNPLRALARVVTITASNVYKGVSSAGISAAFSEEGAEVDESVPELKQPTIYPERAVAFIPFSIEVQQDWGSMTSELSRMLGDARDVLEAEQFLTGGGHDGGTPQPEGLLTGATLTVDTAGTAAIDVDDLYKVSQTVPPRFQPRSQWLGSNTVRNLTRRLVASADATNAQIWSADEQLLLGRSFNEVSTMSTTTTSGDLPLVYGSVGEAFTIVDRVGMTLELIPHLFSDGKPTGRRGLFAMWRTSSAVVRPTALRVLKIKS